MKYYYIKYIRNLILQRYFFFYVHVFSRKRKYFDSQLKCRIIYINNMKYYYIKHTESLNYRVFHLILIILIDIIIYYYLGKIFCK